MSAGTSTDTAAGGSVISLPKGGGAVTGLGEKFAPDPFTGAAAYAVPIAVPPGRLGMQPQLRLVYSTGIGNGPFGLGWQLNLPGVARKTSHGIPRYGAAEQPDVFVLSGMEDLVPQSDSRPGRARYRPRTEGVFARIERVQDGTGDYWEVRARDGLLSRYGTPRPAGADPGWRDPAAVAHPDHPDRVFAWRITQTSDLLGNVVRYAYRDDHGQPLIERVSYVDYGDRAAPSFLIAVEFGYEERPDPHSDRRAGFEIRTGLRCRTIRVVTHAADGVARTAKEYRIRYVQAGFNGASLLSRVDCVGIDGDLVEPLPPLTFGYSGFDPAGRRFEAVTGPGLPAAALTDPTLALVDMRGVGLPDVVELGATQRYWRNAGDSRFEVARAIAEAPPVSLADPNVTFLDADGDGRPDLVVSAAPGTGIAGYFPMTFTARWSRRSFQPYRQVPSVGLTEPDVARIDLDGDGLTDVLHAGVSNHQAWFNDSDRRRAWQRTVAGSGAPQVDLADPRVRLADMTGDGLADIVVLRSGNITYYPNLGHGRWGPVVTMRQSPRPPAPFDPRRLLLGDVDGDGAADLVYVADGRVLVWGNRSGTGWTEQPITITGTPGIVDTDAVRLADLHGTGMAGVMFSRPADGTGRPRLWFLDLTGGVKPYLLSRIDNHLGAVTLVEYRSSTAEYLRDEADAATRWRTTLPFPVRVVSKVEVRDALSRGRLTMRYRYHHGYWDGQEREFRGFGMVEQLDTEVFDGQPRFAPPTLTKRWFHLGPVAAEEIGEWTELDLSGEYWPGDPPLLSRPREQRDFLAGLSRPQRRAALRTLRGQPLRTELYALDGTEREALPYTVTETLAGVRAERDGAFLPFTLGSRTTQWERGDEPLTRFTFPAEPDAYGLPVAQLTVAVPRGRDPSVPSADAEPYLATYATTAYARRDDDRHYVVDRVARTTTAEVVNDGSASVADLWAAIDDARLRLTAHTRTSYDGDAFTGLPIGELGEHGLPVRTEALAFTDEFLADLFPAGAPAYLVPGGAPWPEEYPTAFRDRVPDLAGYRHYREGDVPGSPGGYYCVTARYRYDVHDPARVPRGLLLESLDRLGAPSRIEYDAHDLVPVRTVDAVGLVTEAVADYRVLQPRAVTDVNGNTTEVAFSPAGLVVARYVRGKDGTGDRDEPNVRAIYDVLAFAERGEPASIRSVRRTHHDTETEVPAERRGEVLVSVEYFDGFGRSLQTRAQAEDTLFGDAAFGAGVLPADQFAPPADVVGRTRDQSGGDNVVVTGLRVYDNKGRVVQAYEPFFASGYAYAKPAADQLGQRSTMFYDPRGEVVRTVHPDGSEQRVVLGVPADLANPEAYRPTPWESYTYDANDNAGRTHPDASEGYTHHWNTPSSVEIDALGRPVRAVTRNGAEPITTRSAFDIEGNLLSITDPLDRTAYEYSYDLAGHRWRVVSIDAGTHDSFPDAAGRVVESRDGRGAVTLTAFDILRRPSLVWARNGPTGSVTLRQRVEYGDAGTPDQPAGERGAARDRNLLGAVARHYDEAGLLSVDAVDCKGNVLASERRIIADAPILDTYEAARPGGWRVEPFQVEWTPGPGQGQADRDAELLEPAGYATTTSYDALNRVKRHEHPAGVDGRRRDLVPVYNRSGRLDQLWLEGTAYVRRIAYDAKGQRVLIAFGNSVVTRYAYDPRTFRLARMRTERYTSADEVTYRPAGEAMQDFAYTYDLNGNVLTIKDLVAGSGVVNNPDAGTVQDPRLRALVAAGDALVRRFTYDPTYRLLTATGREHRSPSGDPWLGGPRGTDPTATQPYMERYEYDAGGNVRTVEHRGAGGFTRAYTLGTADNRVHRMTIGTTPYDYSFDANGNIVTEAAVRHFSWNHEDQLVAFGTQTPGAEPSVHAQYLYDATGQRVKKLVRRQGGAVEVTHYLAEVFEHHRWPGGGNTHIAVMDGERRIAEVRVGPAHPDDRGPAVAYHLDDHLGSGTAVVDGTGAITNREEYTPYGETSFGSFTRKRYRFTGRERDEESGLAYHAARYLGPWLARWWSCDPIGPHGGLNPYAYVSGNPLRLVDPSGLGFWDRVWGGVKAVGGAIEVGAGAVVTAAGIATSELGIGVPIAALGVAITAHGADTVVSGVRTAVAGKPVDSVTSDILEWAGLSRRAANLVDAGIGVLFTLGSSAFAKAPTVATTAAGAAEAETLVHLTSVEAKAAIEASQTLGTGKTIYAGRAGLETSSTAATMAKTGLPASKTAASVAVPNAAVSSFRVPVVTGPFTGWQRSFGTVYTAGAGTINLTTGAFTRTGVGWNQLGWYGIDAVTNLMLRGSQALSVPDDGGQETGAATDARGAPAAGTTGASAATAPQQPAATSPLMRMREPARTTPTRRPQPHLSITKTLGD
jgi:RHS repeat-associated protein